MAERSRGSRWTHFLMMLPFFLIGIAIPVYFYGFSGDGPPQLPQSTNTYNPTPEEPAEAMRRMAPPRDSVVGAARGLFERTVDTYISPSLSPLTIKLGLLGVLFVAGFLIVRVALHLITGTLGAVGSFLMHKAAGPMFMGFLAVGSTWGIHQTVADQFGLNWAAATVSITAAVAALFALAGVRVR
ncbi:MAG: hypothetical protein JNK07_01625 [Alphaproteobacteria bacterium]|nr:hypothetical protein [Alphaproteobacteria bacterium]